MISLVQYGPQKWSTQCMLFLQNGIINKINALNQNGYLLSERKLLVHIQRNLQECYHAFFIKKEISRIILVLITAWK